MAGNLFQFTAAVAQMQRDAIFSGSTRVLDADPTERAMHHNTENVATFHRAVDIARTEQRCHELAINAEHLMHLWSDIYEKARDKGLAFTRSER